MLFLDANISIFIQKGLSRVKLPQNGSEDEDEAKLHRLSISAMRSEPKGKMKQSFIAHPICYNV
jgi:hypothetical protein